MFSKIIVPLKRGRTLAIPSKQSDRCQICALIIRFVRRHISKLLLLLLFLWKRNTTEMTLNITSCTFPIDTLFIPSHTSPSNESLLINDWEDLLDNNGCKWLHCSLSCRLYVYVAYDLHWLELLYVFKPCVIRVLFCYNIHILLSS